MGLIERSVAVEGSFLNRDISSQANIERSKMELKTGRSFPVNQCDFRVWDALSSLLPSAGANDDLGLVTGTYGTNAPLIQTGDLKAAGATTRRARVLIPLPDNYADGESVVLRCNAQMVTTVADTSATIDIEAYRLLTDGTLSADLCATSAASINSLTLGSDDFTITATTLVAGDVLDVRVSITVTDGATVTAVIGSLHRLILRCSVRP